MREATSTRNSGAEAISGRASLQSLPLHSELLDLPLLEDFALELDLAELEEDFGAELLLDTALDEEDFGGFTEELLVTLLELSGLIGSKCAVRVVSP